MRHGVPGPGPAGGSFGPSWLGVNMATSGPDAGNTDAMSQIPGPRIAIVGHIDPQLASWAQMSPRLAAAPGTPWRIAEGPRESSKAIQKRPSGVHSELSNQSNM